LFSKVVESCSMPSVVAPVVRDSAHAEPRAATSTGEERRSEPAASAIEGRHRSGYTITVEPALGLPIEDVGSRAVIRTVIFLAASVATLYICFFNVKIMRGLYTSLSTEIFTLMIDLSIPACGYCGAAYHNRQLTCCFCSCNLMLAIGSLVYFIRLLIRLANIGGRCEMEDDPEQKKTCEMWTSDSGEKWLTLSSVVIFFGLGCLAFGFGYRLYHKLSHTSNTLTHAPVTVVGEVVSLNTLVSSITSQNSISRNGTVASSIQDSRGSVGEQGRVGTWLRGFESASNDRRRVP